MYQELCNQKVYNTFAKARDRTLAFIRETVPMGGGKGAPHLGNVDQGSQDQDSPPQASYAPGPHWDEAQAPATQTQWPEPQSQWPDPWQLHLPSPPPALVEFRPRMPQSGEGACAQYMTISRQFW